MVFQSYAIWPHMTVFENVAYPLQVRRMKRQIIHEKVEKVLALVGLEGLENRPGPHLSGGQQQRVAFARALVYEPSVLLMDEPFSNLDAKLREQMRLQVRLLLKRLHDVTVVFVTHDLVEALSLSDRVGVMNHGRIEQIGSPRMLYERPATAFTRDFVGRTVLLKGHTSGSDQDGSISVELDDLPGSRLVVPAVRGQQITPGDPVLAAIRPEAVDIREATSVCESNQFPGRVEALLFVGDHCECRVRLGSEESIVLSVPSTTPLNEGDDVLLHVNAHEVSLWQS
jgi:ABC-type Fe3+/spermidine/putrescine transport system ATPase subunit